MRVFPSGRLYIRALSRWGVGIGIRSEGRFVETIPATIPAFF
jgi:hypothetical protein